MSICRDVRVMPSEQLPVQRANELMFFLIWLRFSFSEKKKPLVTFRLNKSKSDLIERIPQNWCPENTSLIYVSVLVKGGTF